MISFALYVQLFVFLLIAVPFALNRRASLFHPLSFYLAFHMIVFVIRPFMVHYLGFEGRWVYMGYRPTPTEFIDTLWVSSVGLLCFAAACWFGGTAQPRFAETGLPPWSTAEKRAFNVTMAMLGPLAIYSGFFASAGVTFDGSGDVQMTRDLATGNAIYVNTTGYIVQAHAMLGALCLLFLWRFNFRLWAYAPFFIFVGYRAFLGWGRWAIVTALLSLALIYLVRHRRRWFKATYVAAAIPIFVLFQNLGMDRNLVRDYVEGDNPRQLVEYRDSGSYLEALDTPDFANFEFLTYVLWVVPEKSHTYTYFTQYLQLFTEPIPRILWEGKPVGPPIQLINLNDYGNFVGLTVSLVGDGWMSWGWFGVIVTMSLVGLFLGRLHRWFWAHADNPKSVMTYCLFIPLTVLWFRDGGITITKFTLFALAPLILWMIVTKIIVAMHVASAPGHLPPGGGTGRDRVGISGRPRYR